MRKFIVILGLFVIFFSCQEQDKKPLNVLSKNDSIVYYSMLNYISMCDSIGFHHAFSIIKISEKDTTVFLGTLVDRPSTILNDSLSYCFRMGNDFVFSNFKLAGIEDSIDVNKALRKIFPFEYENYIIRKIDPPPAEVTFDMLNIVFINDNFKKTISEPLYRTFCESKLLSFC